MPKSTTPPNIKDFGYCTRYQAGHFYYAKHSSGTFHYMKLKSGISYFAKRKYSIVMQYTKRNHTKRNSHGYHYVKIRRLERRKKEEYTEAKSVIKIFGIVVDVSFSLLFPVIQ